LNVIVPREPALVFKGNARERSRRDTTTRRKRVSRKGASWGRSISSLKLTIIIWLGASLGKGLKGRYDLELRVKMTLTTRPAEIVTRSCKRQNETVKKDYIGECSVSKKESKEAGRRKEETVAA